MKEESFYQCEHCVYYTPYYNICEYRIWKVNCGHCEFRKKTIRPSLRDCQHFKLLTKTDKTEKNKKVIKDYEKYLCDTLYRIEKSVKCLKLYLDKDKEIQLLDSCIIEDIKKT